VPGFPPWVHRIHLKEDLPPSAGQGSTGLGSDPSDPGKRAQSADLARTLVQNAPETERRWVLDWVELILVYKLPQLTREEIRMIIDLQDPDLKRSRFYQEVFAEGWDDGLEKGREEGRKAEAAAFVLRLLTRRFGAPSDAVVERIQALPVEQVERLGEDLLDFTGLDDLAAWLAS
jgi:predicted transposase YdaD